jgi:hypothetical protein
MAQAPEGVAGCVECGAGLVRAQQSPGIVMLCPDCGRAYGVYDEICILDRPAMSFNEVPLKLYQAIGLGRQTRQ